MPKRQLTINYRTDVAGILTEGIKVKETEHLLQVEDVTEPGASPVLCPKMLEAKMEMQETMLPVFPYHSVDFQEIGNKQESTQVDLLLHFVVLVISDPPYSVGNTCEENSSPYYVPIFEELVDADSL